MFYLVHLFAVRSGDIFLSSPPIDFLHSIRRSVGDSYNIFRLILFWLTGNVYYISVDSFVELKRLLCVERNERSFTTVGRSVDLLAVLYS